MGRLCKPCANTAVLYKGPELCGLWQVWGPGRYQRAAVCPDLNQSVCLCLSGLACCLERPLLARNPRKNLALFLRLLQGHAFFLPCKTPNCLHHTIQLHRKPRKGPKEILTIEIKWSWPWWLGGFTLSWGFLYFSKHLESWISSQRKSSATP